MRIVLAVMTMFALAAAGDPLRPEWRVTLKLLAGDDAGAVARQLAATYRGTLLSPVDDASATFAIAISGSSVELLRADHRVARVEAQAGDEPPRARAGTNTAAPAMILGDYAYDGSGNITAIGADTFLYDGLKRLESASVANRQQDYTYDAFGNILTITTDDDAAMKKTLGVNAATNRMDRSSAPNNVFGTYDDAGNMTGYLGVDSYAYDGAGMVKESEVGGIHRAYLYSASDERIATLYSAGSNVVRSEWTLRDAGGAVLRRFTKQGTTWSWAEDYIYRGATLLAANTPAGTQHFHLDHLGSPRLITTDGGVEITRHTYLPFGEEPAPSNDPEPRRFTGHEKDDVNLYYMHARYYLPYAGRFLSVDPVLDQKLALKSPQAWNRYAYVRNNPVGAIDPTGMLEALLYGKVHDVNPGDVVVLVNKQGEVKHVAVVAGFVEGKNGPEALIYENAPTNKRGSLQDSAPHEPQLINSNSPRAGGGIWNGRTLSVGGIAENKAPMFGMRYLSLARFSQSDVTQAARSVGPVQYDSRAWGSLGVTCDCAGFVNQLVNALNGSLRGNKGYLGPGKTISDWLREATDDD